MSRVTSYAVVRRDGQILPSGFKGEHDDTDDSETRARLLLTIAALQSVGYEVQFSAEEPEDEDMPKDGMTRVWVGGVRHD